jgi:structural maintenance of chromosome 2
MNMKPPEILSLLEEASGTKLYERKKEAAVKTLSKKQARLGEIDQLMEQELLPSLRRLEQQCAAYHDYAVASQKHEKLRRFCVAYDYHACREALASGEHELAALLQEARDLGDARDRAEAEAAERASEVAALEAEKEIQAGGEVKELQDEADALALQLTRDTTAWKQQEEARGSEGEVLAALRQQLAELDEAGLAAKVDAATAARDEAAAALAAAERGVEAAAGELAGAEAGDGRDESGRSLAERLADAKSAQTEADAEAQAADMRAKHAAKAAQDKKRALGAKQAEATKLQKELERAEREAAAARAKVEAAGYDEREAAELERARGEARAEVRRLKESAEALGAQVGAGVDVAWTPPPGFDRSKVKGVVARLVRVRDERAALALEVAAGGQLYHLVVEDDAAGQRLLDAKGALQRRVTLIALNRAASTEMARDVVDKARELTGGKARPAIELVGSAPEVSAAIKKVFGGTFVCDDAAAAKKVALGREVARRAVTLDGDDFNPAGVLTGGSRPSASVLTTLARLAEAEDALRAAELRLSEAESGLARLASAAKAHASLAREAELKEHALALLADKVRGSESQQLAEAAAACEREAEEVAAAAEAARQRKREMVSLAATLEREIADFGKDRDKRLKAAQAKGKAAKAELERARKAARAAEAALQAAVAEAGAAGDERAKLAAQAEAGEAALASLASEVEALRARVDAANAAYAAAAARLEEKRARLRACDAEIRALEQERDAAARRAADSAASRRRVDARLADKRGDLVGARQRLQRLEQDHDWIPREKASFGAARGEFDFAAVDARESYEAYEALTLQLKAMRERGVERQAEAMYRRNQEEVEGLKAKRAQVERDRAQISAVIDELDEKKRAALGETWRRVDGDFGAIFSTLLPGTAARLVPPEGGTFLDGLEVRVAFGGVWKESLTELSGGQRSLLALSLVLALCRFRPAPIYILDEVDAALDLSHTQNIGAMIRQHFPQSQFVVVSLKEGMFNNASVLFRTKFVDGVSTVARTVGGSGGGSGGGGAPAGGGAAGKGAAVAAAAPKGRGRAALREAN